MRTSLVATLAAILAAVGPVGTALAQNADMREAGPPTLNVTGEATVTGEPDLALIALGVVEQAASAREALTENSDAMARIIDALKGQGIAPRDLQTSGFSVDPVYSQPPRDYDGSEPFEPRIVGYSVRNELTLRIRDLARTGALLDAVITLGANSISGPSFTVDDPTRLQDEARRAAVEDALRKARLYSEAAGVALGPISRIEEGAFDQPRPLPMAAMARDSAMEAKSVPIEGGELGFRAQVSVSWQLGR